MPDSATPASVLVVDDEVTNRQALKLVLEDQGYQILEAADGEEGCRMAQLHEPDVVLLDIQMPRLDGMQALVRLKESRAELPVLMISGHGTISTAVEALRLGADDFLEKPLEREIVLKRVAAVLERRELKERVDAIEKDDEERYRLIGESDAMDRIRELIERAGPTQATVLITGESGTGKELVARAIHSASKRAGRPFIKVNCAAIPDELIESELFGHEKGAFTGAASRQKGRFARAHGGTLFLDEIGDMSLKTQAKVLRALQDGEIEPLGAGSQVRVDVRVIAATNKNLLEEIENGEFREDLYYRLNVLPIELPPLRERRDDIKLLVDHLAVLICAENNFRLRTFTDAAMSELTSRSWTGNVRELRNYVERAIILAPEDELDRDDLPIATSAKPSATNRLFDIDTLKDFKETAEREYLVRKLEQNGWNITKTAQAIGTPRSNLYKKLEHYQLGRGDQVTAEEAR